jgi:hypothetical protein
MPLQQITATLRTPWLAHDAWSEAFVGSRNIAYRVLPETDNHGDGDQGGLCKLVLVGANQLMEIALHTILKPHANSIQQIGVFVNQVLEDASYYQMLHEWLPHAIGTHVQFQEEPFRSTEKLRKRRNDTIHKAPAVANIQMARSALYSAVEGTKVLFQLSNMPFPYGAFLSKHPVPNEIWFSQVRYPGEA